MGSRLGTSLLVALVVGIVVGAVSSFYWSSRDRENDRKTASAELAVVKRNTAMLEAERNKLGTELVKRESDLATLQTKYIASADELENLKKKNSELAARTAQLNKQVRQLKEDLGRLRQQAATKASRN
jgi:septal ring factor EnvC (AmiA/AmiB activator)